MKRVCKLMVTALISIYLFKSGETVKAAGICDGIKPGQKIYWEGGQLLRGQIGLLSILGDTTIYHFINGKMDTVKSAGKGQFFRIYTFKQDYLGVGAGYYVNREADVTYRTPSKQKLLAVKCANGLVNPDNGGGNVTPPVTPPPPPTPVPNVDPIDLGPQVFNISTMASKAGMDDYGNAYLYVILQGTPASLGVVELNTNKVVGVYPLTNSTSAWGIDVDNEGIVWIGGTGNSNLYSFNPNTRELKNYGDMLVESGDTSIQGLVVNDQFVYGSTAYGANVFAFNKKTLQKEFLLPTVAGKKIGKSIAVDPSNQFLYVSSGPNAELLKWDLSNQSKTSIMTTDYQDEDYAEKMRWIDHYLAVKFLPSRRANLYDTESGTFLTPFDVDSRGFSPKDENLNEFFFTYQANFYAYNLSSKIIQNLNVTLPSKKNALSLDFVKLRNNPTQNIVTGLIDNQGRYFLFNPATNQLKIKKAIFTSQEVELNLIFSDPDKRYVYANGFMTGGLTQYDTVENKSVQLSGVNQLESALFLNGKLYGGAYPKAKLLEISPNQSWDLSSSRELISLDKFGQERITALANNNNNNNHLFAGTYPQGSSKGGLILDYDLDTGNYSTYEDYIHNQSIISLLGDGNELYGGSSIHANYQRAEDGAKFFRFNPSNPTDKQILNLPLNASMVMSLIKGPDGDIWGMADGTMFAYHPATNSFRTVKILKAISGRFSNAKLLAAKNGSIYGTVEGVLFKMNPEDMTYVTLLDNGAYDIAEDAKGNIYYRNYANLYMFPEQ